MDPYKYSAVSHRELLYCNPINSAKMEELIELLQFAPQARIVDFGSGKAELLIRLVERYGVEAVGIDRSPYFTQEAREHAAARIPDGRLTLLETDVADFQAEPGSFDLAVCMGATEVFGGYTGTLEALSALVRPGGYVAVGEGYWKREPAQAYLDLLGATREEFASHAENVVAGVARQLTPLYAWASSEDDWDRYEWVHCGAVERYARQHPDDPDVPALLNRIRSWRDLYLTMGRDTLGFGLYLFQK